MCARTRTHAWGQRMHHSTCRGERIAFYLICSRISFPVHCCVLSLFRNTGTLHACYPTQHYMGSRHSNVVLTFMQQAVSPLSYLASSNGLLLKLIVSVAFIWLLDCIIIKQTKMKTFQQAYFLSRRKVKFINCYHIWGEGEGRE